MSEVRDVIIMLWVSMFASIIILTILNADYDIFRAFIIGIVVLALTIAYILHGWYCECKDSKPKVKSWVRRE